MSNAWESSFSTWANGPGKTEAEKCDNAETAVRKAIQSYEPLTGWDISVFAQGSYKVRTNIRLESDVDICVRLDSPTFFAKYPEGKTREDFGNTKGTIAFADYRNLIDEALSKYFGKGSVFRGEKAFDIHANTYRVDADVVPALEHRRYTGRLNPDGSHHFYRGVAFNVNGGGNIVNWPDQNYVSGNEKNSATNRRYKRVVRILKNLRTYMHSKDVAAANDISSFLIESLVWNAPNYCFSSDEYWENVKSVLAFLITNTRVLDTCNKWVEVNEMKYLFRSSQPWTFEQAHAFVSAAWQFLQMS